MGSKAMELRIKIGAMRKRTMLVTGVDISLAGLAITQRPYNAGDEDPAQFRSDCRSQNPLMERLFQP